VATTPSFTLGAPASYTKIQRYNLHPNPRGTVGTTNMALTASTGTWNTVAHQGISGPIAGITSAFEISVATGSPAWLDCWNNPATNLPINPKLSYNFSSYVRGVAPTTSTVGHYITWFAGDGTSVISTTSVTGIPATNNVWQRIEIANPTIPTNARYAIYTVRVFSSSTFAAVPADSAQFTGFLVEATG
jgi:hypothetical protein